MTKYVFHFRSTSVHGIKFDDNNEEKKEYIISYERKIDMTHVDFKMALKIVYTILKEENDGSEIMLGLSIPGVIDVKNQKVMTESMFRNIDVDFASYFSPIKNIVKIEIQNDAKAALLGEYYFGQEKLKNNIFMFSVGLAIGGAAIINGQLLQGSHNFACEFSKMYASISKKNQDSESSIYCGTMQARYRLALAKNKNVDEIHWSTFKEMFYQNDDDAKKIFDTWTSAVAKQIININLVLDVEQIVIGNNVIDFPEFITTLKEKIDYYSKKVKLPAPEIKVATLKNKANAYGVLAMLEGKNKNEK